MGSKYKPHILDPEVLNRSWQMYSDADWYRDAANRLYVNEPLGAMGRDELAKIREGQFGSTLMGGAIRQQAGRDIEAARRSNTLGAAALMRAGNTPGSMAAGILYDRLLRKQIGEIQDRAADQLASALPGYVSSVGEWAEAPNRNIAQQATLRGLFDQARLAATRLRQSNFAYDKAPSAWEKIVGGFADIGGIASTIAGLGGLFGIPGKK